MKELIEVAKQMINDYLYYGYGLETWIEQDYPITKTLGIETIKRLFKEQKEKLGKMVPDEFAFGYAITVHKAQGSEWSKVLTIEENFPFDKKEHARWLYTAISRSAEKCVLIK